VYLCVCVSCMGTEGLPKGIYSNRESEKMPFRTRRYTCSIHPPPSTSYLLLQIFLTIVRLKFSNFLYLLDESSGKIYIYTDMDDFSFFISFEEKKR